MDVTTIEADEAVASSLFGQKLCSSYGSVL